MQKQELYKQHFAKSREQKRCDEINLRRRERTHQREQQYQKSRCIFPESSEVETNKQTLEKNLPNLEKKKEADKEKKSNILVLTKNENLHKKQTEYLQRFLEWKKLKKNANNKENAPPKKPFIPAGISSRNQLASNLQFTTREHIVNKPKPALSNKGSMPEIVSTNRGRPSIYTVAPLPGKRTLALDKKKECVNTGSNRLKNSLSLVNAANTRNTIRNGPIKYSASGTVKTVAMEKSSSVIKPFEARNPNLAVNMKSTNIKTNVTRKLRLTKEKIDLAMKEKKTDDIEIKTPLDIKPTRFPNFYTSTQIKKVCVNVVPDNTSPLNVKNDANCIYNQISKEFSPVSSKLKMLHDTAKTKENNDIITKLPHLVKEEETPPVNYLSPYVSVSRGKVSRQHETSRRSSFYLELEDLMPPNTEKIEESKNLSLINEHNNTTRHILESVRYYRNQLNSEIGRLNALCDSWDLYKQNNLQQLVEKGCDDMIDAALGQTRLLLSKKFIQFKGLVDRCEAYANGTEIPCKDGSEDKRLITASDLEGFWSMVNIQVDNLDNRFEKLNLWRDNNWNDPETEKVSIVCKKGSLMKIKPNLLKGARKTNLEVKRPTKPSVPRKETSCAEFIQMMRRKKAENFKKTSIDNEIHNEEKSSDVNITPSQINFVENNCGSAHKSGKFKTRNSYGQQITVIVKDRKMFSPSPTILKINQSSKRKSIDKNQFIKQTPQETIGKINLNSNQFETALVDTPRKSILKTPASIRNKFKNVAFQEKLRVHKFNFFDNDESHKDTEN